MIEHDLRLHDGAKLLEEERQIVLSHHLRQSAHEDLTRAQTTILGQVLRHSRLDVQGLSWGVVNRNSCEALRDSTRVR